MKFALYAIAAASAVNATQLKYEAASTQVVDNLEEAQDDLIVALKGRLSNKNIIRINPIPSSRTQTTPIMAPEEGPSHRSA